jgi:hypothetical protein
MHTEGFDAGRNLAAEAMAAEAALKQMAEQGERARTDFPEDFVPRPTAMHGLAAAVPLSLSLWTMVMVLLWMWARKG